MLVAKFVFPNRNKDKILIDWKQCKITATQDKRRMGGLNDADYRPKLKEIAILNSSL